MRDIQVVVERDDIHDFVHKLWKTDLFRESHDDATGVVNSIVDEFSYLPRMFARSTNDRLERAHFATWWNVIMLRDDYTNPYIHDLYLVHEMFHAARMPYIPEIGKAAFAEKMQRNELEASVFSEIQIYFEMEGLREASFNHPIYADRFLNDPDIKQLWKINQTVAIETIRSMRRDVMTSKPEHLMDLTERWVRIFNDQNAVYASTWAYRYQEVERQMSEFQILASQDRAAASRFHTRWIIGEMEKDPVDNIPFREEAELFTPFYWSNKAHYDAAMKEK